MTPLEKAARETWKLREQYMWPDRARRPVPDDIDYASGAFAKVETETRAIITAFLEAAAEDEVVLGRLECSLAYFIGGNRQPHMSGDPRNRLSPLQRRNTSDAAVSAILALKETING